MALVSAAAVWATSLSWRAFTLDPRSYVWSLALVGLVVAGTGVLGRWVRLPWPLIAVAQLLLGGATVSLLLTGSPLPVGAAGTDLAQQVDTATHIVRTARPPVAVADGIAPLLLGGGLGCFVVVDVVACALRRPAVAGLPLLAAYAVPFSVVEGGLPWWGFALAAAGFLGMLVLGQADAVNRWGRRLGASGDSTTGSGAATLGAAATVLALVLPTMVPTLDLRLFGMGPGSGDGTRIQVTNPLVDLRRDLVRGPDLPAVRVRTDDPSPSYLRLAVLNRFGDNEWTAGDRTVPARNDASGPLPSLLGVATWVKRTTHRYEVSVSSSFDSRWLPTQAPISDIEAPGDWRYDTRTMDFLAGDRGLTAAGLDYSMTSVDLALDSADLVGASASPGTVGASYLDLPDNFPRVATRLATSVTASAQGDFAKAVALQDWFRTGGGFVYDDGVPLRSSPGDLETFLTVGPDGRRGYCQQFAAAMAAMARSLGIPARVAVGFLRPDKVGPRTWLYSTHDLHAWPELFFSGAGWVRFEPTPAARAATVPGYTLDVGNARPDPEPSDLPSASRPSSAPSNAPRPREEQRTTADGATAQQGTSWWWLAGAAAGLGALALAAAVPSRIRRRRRTARLASGAPEDAWRELRDTALDLGLPWHAGLSPRATEAALGQRLPDADARRALERLREGLELDRYSARAASRVAPEDVETVRAAMAASVTDRAARRAGWWPRSVLRRSPGGTPIEGRELLDQVR